MGVINVTKLYSCNLTFDASLFKLCSLNFRADKMKASVGHEKGSYFVEQSICFIKKKFSEKNVDF